ncbi:MAG: hypothetical protein V4580_19930 [Bacteroidota bacterium]
MKTYLLSMSLALLSLVSCNAEKKPTVDSYELTTRVSVYDTINKIVDGKKQGLWLMPVSKDTVVYLNDTMHSVTNMTSGEMIRHLKIEGNKGIIALPAEFTIKSN